MKPPFILRFGVFEADLRSGELRKRGAQIKLQYQPFQILVALLNRPGELVTREELRQQLWPADTFVDFDHSLNAAIKRLRDALGESADSPNLIETLPRRGYRFLGSVTAVDVHSPQSDGQTAVAPERPAAHAVDKRGYWRRYALPVVVALLLLAATAVYFRYDNWLARFAGSDALPPTKVVPFTTDPGAEMHPSFSPDGKQAAYVKWDGQSNFDANVYVKLIGGNQELQITHGSAWACCTTWSPDGLFVAYERCDGDHQGIFLVPSMGGPERRLTDQSCEGISWSPDGVWMAITRGEPPAPQSIFLLRMKDLQLQRLTSPVSPDRGDHLPEFSPDGKLLAFVRQASASVDDLFVIPTTGGEPRRLTTDNAGIHGLAWTRDGRSLVFASHRAGGTSLWKIPATGGAPVSVPVGGADVEELSIASKGNRLLYTQGGIYPNIWEIPLGPDRKAQTSRPLLDSTTGQGNPQFSADGSRIAFYSRRSGSPEIWVCNSDGSNPVELTSLGVLTETPRWSPDGKMIAFDSRPAGHSQVLILPSGGGEPRPLTGPEDESTLSSWSRDGRWIYYTSNRGGLWQIWKIPSAGGKAIQVTDNGGFVAFESANGKDLVYTKYNESGFWMRSIEGGPESRILNVRVFWGHWALGRSGIYFVDQTGAQAVVKYYDFAEHKISSITPLARPLPPEEGALTVSPDERRILVMEVVTNKDIMLVENFH